MSVSVIRGPLEGRTAIFVQPCVIALILVYVVCEAAPICLFWAPNELNELPAVRFEFPFNLIGKLTITF